MTCSIYKESSLLLVEDQSLPDRRRSETITSNELSSSPRWSTLVFNDSYATIRGLIMVQPMMGLHLMSDLIVSSALRDRTARQKSY